MPKPEGPLTTLFGNPHGRAIARILDHAVLTGNTEQSIQMISTATRLNYKTVQKALDKLEPWGMVAEGRRIGGTQTFKFNVENNLHDLVSFARKLALIPK